MKRSVTFFLFIFLYWTSAHAAEKTGRDIGLFEGPVHLVVETTSLVTIEDGVRSEGPERMLLVSIYDKPGNRVEWYEFDDNGKFFRRKVARFAPPGFIQAGATYNAEGAILSTFTATYDPITRRVFTDAHDELGKVYKKTIARYDRAGNRVKVIEISTDNQERYYLIFRYDSKNRIIEEDQRSVNRLEFQKQYFYNLDGSLAKITENYQRSEVEIIRTYGNYRFDEYGNWIQRGATSVLTEPNEKDMKRLTVSRRVISYY